MRVVLDTSVLVSFLLTRGHVISAIIEQWETGRLEVIVSPQLIAELIRVAEDERLANCLHPGALEVLLRALTENAEVVAGELELPGVTEDPDDDMVVALYLAVQDKCLRCGGQCSIYHHPRSALVEDGHL